MTDFPSSCGVMFLPGVTLFPQTQLPLRIFEMRYRRMLEAALDNSRMFAVAMDCPEESPENSGPVVGLGLIKSSLQQPDGTSLLVLEGVGRVRLLNCIHETPYPRYAINRVATVDDIGEPEAAIREQLIGLCSVKISEEEGQLLTLLNEIGQFEALLDHLGAHFIPSPKDRNILMKTVSLKERAEFLMRLLGS